MDFTLDKYKELLDAFDDVGQVTLRHDVDKKPKNSLATAYIEREMGWEATYYFRAVPESFDPGIILHIASLGHQIGYHYESLATCKGNMEAAYDDFCRNLEKLRTLAEVRSICMHGSPRSPWDSRDLWKHYDYHTLGIDYEPYLDTDFSRTLYLTDTGRRWDGHRVSVRDKIPQFQDEWERRGLVYHTTAQLIAQLTDSQSPLRASGLSLLITTHPQRWNPFGPAYVKEWALQHLKNVVKKVLVDKEEKK